MRTTSIAGDPSSSSTDSGSSACSAASASRRALLEVGAGDDLERVERGSVRHVRVADDAAPDDADACRRPHTGLPTMSVTASNERRTASSGGPSVSSCSTSSHSTPSPSIAGSSSAVADVPVADGHEALLGVGARSFTCTSGTRGARRSTRPAGSTPANHAQPRSTSKKSSSSSSSASRRGRCDRRRAGAARRRGCGSRVEARRRALVARSRCDPLDDRVRLGGRGRWSDPPQHEAIGSDRSKLIGQLVEIALDSVEKHVPAADFELELVEQRPHSVRVMPVEVEELDSLVADLANGPEHSVQVALALAAQGVQHQSDARSHQLSSRLTKWPRRSSTSPVGMSGSQPWAASSAVSPVRPSHAVACRPASGRGTAVSRSLVYACRGSCRTSSVGAVLDDAALVHDVDLVRDVPRAREVVRDVQEGELLALLQLAHEVEDPEPDRHVEHRDRLVGEDDLRLCGQGPRDRDALPLTARQLVRVLRGDRLGGDEADRLEQLVHAGGHLVVFHDAMDPERSGDVVVDPLDGIQRRERILEDHLHLRSERAHPSAATQAGDVFVLEHDRAPRRLVQVAEQACHGALAAAALPHEGRDASAPQGEADVVYRAQRLPTASPEARADRKGARERPGLEHGRGGATVVTTALPRSGMRRAGRDGRASGAAAPRPYTARARARTADGTCTRTAAGAGRAGCPGSRS